MRNGLPVCKPCDDALQATTTAVELLLKKPTRVVNPCSTLRSKHCCILQVPS